jgi:hypothetical protein
MIEWEKRMSEYLNVQSVKYQYATYAELVTELPTNEEKSEGAGDDNVDMMVNTFEEVPCARRLESQVEWESAVFEQYLKQLLGEQSSEEAKDLRDAQEESGGF